MAIKIISKGVDPKTTPLRGTCSNCRTEVECQQSDAKYNDNYDCRDPRESAYYSVVCPVCSSGIYLRKYIPHDGRGPG